MGAAAVPDQIIAPGFPKSTQQGWAELRHEQSSVCSGRADLMKRKTAVQQQLGEKSEKSEISSPAGTKITVERE